MVEDEDGFGEWAESSADPYQPSFGGVVDCGETSGSSAS